MIFDTPKSVNKLTASEAAEAGLTRPKTTALMSGGYMSSFNLLGQFKRSESLDTLSFFRGKIGFELRIKDIQTAYMS